MMISPKQKERLAWFEKCVEAGKPLPTDGLKYTVYPFCLTSEEEKPAFGLGDFVGTKRRFYLVFTPYSYGTLKISRAFAQRVIETFGMSCVHSLEGDRLYEMKGRPFHERYGKKEGERRRQVNHTKSDHLMNMKIGQTDVLTVTERKEYRLWVQTAWHIQHDKGSYKWHISKNKETLTITREQ